MLNNGWQLAVVDYDLAEDEARRNDDKIVLDALASNRFGNICSGTICYIASIYEDQLDDTLPNEWFCAKVWYPETKRFGYVLLSALRPILTEEDAIEMELKFNIDLHKFCER